MTSEDEKKKKRMRITISSLSLGSWSDKKAEEEEEERKKRRREGEKENKRRIFLLLLLAHPSGRLRHFSQSWKITNVQIIYLFMVYTVWVSDVCTHLVIRFDITMSLAKSILEQKVVL